MATHEYYRHFSARDFIKDEYFQRWVYQRDSESDAFWQGFLREYPLQAENVREAMHFLRLLDCNEEDVFQSRIDALKQRIDAGIEGAPPRSLPRRATGRGLSKRFVWLKWAATVVIACAAVWGATQFFKRTQALDKGLLEQVTARAQRTVITLEDGTRIWLNVDTRIAYPKTFENQAVREISLDGEAYFQVTSDSTRPFIVNTEGVRVTVLGTTFLIKSYESEERIETTLVEGRVVVESLGEKFDVVVLKPSQVASYDKNTKRIKVDDQPKAESAAGWKDGRLVFDDKPLSEIVSALERWYDVHITVEDRNALKCHFSAKIEDLSLVEVLELFKASDGIEYNVVGKYVTIKGAICNP